MFVRFESKVTVTLRMKELKHKKRETLFAFYILLTKMDSGSKYEKKKKRKTVLVEKEKALPSSQSRK